MTLDTHPYAPFLHRVAEQSGLIRQLSEWIMETACSELAVLKRSHPGQVGMRLFDPDKTKPKGLQLGPLDVGDSEAYEDIFDSGDPNDEEPPAAPTPA